MNKELIFILRTLNKSEDEAQEMCHEFHFNRMAENERALCLGVNCIACPFAGSRMTLYSKVYSIPLLNL